LRLMLNGTIDDYNNMTLIITTMRPLLTIFFSMLISCNLLFPQADNVEIITLYDSYQTNTLTRTDWGFSCLVIHENDTILFDAGNREDIFVHNLKVLGIDISTVQTMVISHHHGDHTGNVFNVLSKNPGMKVFLPSSLDGEYEDQVEDLGGKACLKSSCKRISKDIYLSGEMGFQIKEQALVIDTKKGLVIIAGCAHPGIDRMVSCFIEKFQKDVFLVMGGFHTQEANRQQALEIIDGFKKMGVEKVAPSHCTGKLTMKLFKDAFQSDFIQNGTGKIIEI